MQAEIDSLHCLTLCWVQSTWTRPHMNQGKTTYRGCRMSGSRCSVVVSLVPAVLLLSWPGGTHFYIDPGTGSLVIQAVIGGFAAVLVAIGVFWKQIKAFVSNLFSRFKHHEPPQDQQH
jgi:hypothetical protein